MSEFDYQWKNLPSKNIEYSEDRAKELLKLTKLPASFFEGKLCLDAGCGSGRYTYAMQRLGANVDSFDLSEEVVNQCKKINPKAYVFDLLNLDQTPIYDFVLCWGVLHHLPDPRLGFQKVASQLRCSGILHIMVYHRKTQEIYEEGRQRWQNLGTEERLRLVQEMIQKIGGDVHGWWDAFNPRYNWSFEPREIERWFRDEGFEDIKLTQKYNINMRGKKK